MRIVLTGGGTGGHVMPFEPIIESLRTTFLAKKDSLPKDTDKEDLQLSFLGIADKETKDFFASYDVPSWNIPSGKMRRYASALNFSDLLFRLPIGIVLALVRMYSLMPDVVVSKGGYGSIPVVFAALFYRIPILLHESDTVPGKTNLFLMPFANIITLGFKEAVSSITKWEFKAIVTGTPVRSNLTNITQKESKEYFGFTPEQQVLLVMGGSQGAKQINETLLQSLPVFITQTAILHITGPSQFTAVSTVAQEILTQSSHAKDYKVFPYLTTEMTKALNAADAVITRGGASTLAELIRLKKPMLIIPLDGAASDHQRKNAQALEAAGAAVVLDPINVGKNLFEQNVERILTNADLRSNLIRNMETIDRPDAAKHIAELVFALASGLEPEKKA